MKIQAIDIFQVDIPMSHQYTMSGGRVWNSLDTTIVKITTENGLIGWGESCPWGPNYLPGHAKGVRAGLEELAPSLLGVKANELDVVNEVMDQNLAGHSYVKHAIDMACWDLFGKSVKLPLYVLLGGARQHKLHCVASVPSGTPEAMVGTVERFRDELGYSIFSCKLSGDLKNDFPAIGAIMESGRRDDVYIFDANKGFNMADGLRCATFLSKYDVVFEQPTKTYEEFAAIRSRSTVPMMIDEIFTGMETMWRIIADKSCELVNLKLAKVGGLSKARLIRDICQQHGIMVSVQCCGGSEITQAAIMHLAASTGPHYMHCIWDCTDHNGVKIVPGVEDVRDGILSPRDLPGLGVEPDPGVLGEPVARFSSV